jgi:hypothetical protein
MVKRAITLPRTQAGALTLGTDRFQQATAQAQLYAAALRPPLRERGV